MEPVACTAGLFHNLYNYSTQLNNLSFFESVGAKMNPNDSFFIKLKSKVGHINSLNQTVADILCALEFYNGETFSLSHACRLVTAL